MYQKNMLSIENLKSENKYRGTTKNTVRNGKTNVIDKHENKSNQSENMLKEHDLKVAKKKLLKNYLERRLFLKDTFMDVESLLTVLDKIGNIKKNYDNKYLRISCDYILQLGHQCSLWICHFSYQDVDFPKQKNKNIFMKHFYLSN